MRRWATAAVVVVAGALLAQAAAGETLLIVRKSAAALDFIDPGSGLRLATVPVGPEPHEISTSPDGRRAAVSNYGTAERPGTTLSIVDLERPRELRRIDLSPHSRPHGLAWFAPDLLAVTTEGSRHLLIVNPASGQIVSAIDTGQDGSHMVAVAPDGARAYVANRASGSVTALDLRAGVKIADVATGRGSEGIAITPDGQELWVAAREDGDLAIVNTRSLQVEAKIALPGAPIRLAMAPDGRTAFVSCAGSSELLAFDVASRRERTRRRIEVPLAPDAAQRPSAQLAPGSPEPVGLLVSPAGRNLYVAATLGDVVVRFDAAMLAVQQISAVDGEPDGLAVTAVLPRAVCHACAPEAR